MKRYRHYTDPPPSANARNGYSSSSNSFVQPQSNNYYPNWTANYDGAQFAKHPRLNNNYNGYRPSIVGEPWRRSMPNITVKIILKNNKYDGLFR